MFTTVSASSRSRVSRAALVLLAVTALVGFLLIRGVSTAGAGTSGTTTGTATATVTGQVLGINGDPGSAWDDPLPGVRVSVLDAASGSFIRSAKTDALGHYRIGGLTAGAVKVRADKPGWVTTFANGKSTRATADVFTLQAGKTRSVKMTIYAEAVIQGQVLSWMDPIDAARVTVVDAATGAWVASALAADSTYRIGGLPAGSYQVRATKAGYVTAWAGGTSRADADVYTVYAGQTLSQSWDDPLVLYLDLAPEARLEGDVLGINDDPGSPWDDPLPGVRVSVLDAHTGAYITSAKTDALGHYRVGGLRGGDVKIRADKAGWVMTFANGKPTRAAADVFALQAGESQQVNMTIYAEAAIQGQVLSQMDPIDGARVTVFDATTGAWVASAVAADSYYRIGGLPAGAYKVRATKTGYVTAWAGGTSRADADVYTLYAGQTLSQSWDDPLVLYLDLAPIQGS